MKSAFDFPFTLFVVAFVALVAAARIGTVIARRQRALDPTAREDFNLVLAATLTLLGLIIGFSFSMALSRYDKRIELEEGEANAIGTASLRIELLAATDAAKLRQLLGQYVSQRIAYYRADDGSHLDEINAKATKLQTEMWNTVKAAIAGQPTPINALVAEGMNDVINAQGYVQAAWRNRIPAPAWMLMAAIALTATGLVGFVTEHRGASRSGLLLVLPFIVALAWFLIADIESPRDGLIRVVPNNLLAVEQSLRTP